MSFTGELSYLSREEAKAVFERLGATVGNPTMKTTRLVIGKFSAKFAKDGIYTSNSLEKIIRYRDERGKKINLLLEDDLPKFIDLGIGPDIDDYSHEPHLANSKNEAPVEAQFQEVEGIVWPAECPDTINNAFVHTELQGEPKEMVLTQTESTDTATSRTKLHDEPEEAVAERVIEKPQNSIPSNGQTVRTPVHTDSPDIPLSQNDKPHLTLKRRILSGLAGTFIGLATAFLLMIIAAITISSETVLGFVALLTIPVGVMVAVYWYRRKTRQKNLEPTEVTGSRAGLDRDRDGWACE